MKNIVKVLFIFLNVFLLAGCFGNMAPSEKTEDMLNRYIKNDKSIIEELDSYLDKQNLSKSQTETYKDIIKDEYATMKYTIKDEKIDGDEATVEVEMDVKDLYKASKEASEYLINHPEEFYTDDVYDETKFIDFKLSKMKENKERVTYTIDINLKRKDGIWTIEDLDEKTLQKIHGIYDYES